MSTLVSSLVRRTRSSLHRRGARAGVAAVLAVATAVAATTLGASGAASGSGPVSQSEGRYLSGSVLGTDLDNVAGLAPADASNSGGATDTQLHPLDVTALNAINLPLGGGLQLLGANGLLTLGAVNQYAQANPDGSSLAGSGTVTDGGAIGIGTGGVPQSTASVKLDGLLPSSVTSAVANLSLDVGAIAATAAQAAGANGAQTGDYGIASLKLNLTSPLLGSTLTTLSTTLGGLQSTVDGLQATLNSLLLGVVTIDGLPNLTDLLSGLSPLTVAGGAISVDLLSGAITVDVGQLLTFLHLDLNDLAPNTSLLPYITSALTSDLLPALTAALTGPTGLVSQITDAIHGLKLTVLGLSVDPSTLLSTLDPVIATVTAPIASLAGTLGGVLTPLSDGLTALDGVLSLVANVQETSGGTFTERALQVNVLGAAGGAVQVNLASASVGPNAGPSAVVVPTASGLNPNHGPAAGGTTVTVTGTGFVPGATSVTIGGNTVAAKDVTVNAAGTSLTFSTPAHAAGGVTVTATTAGGTTAPLAYTYDPPTTVPAPIITTPSDGSTVSTPTPPIGGTGVAGDTVTVTEGGTSICTAKVAATGRWSCVPTTPLAVGDHTVTATQTDPAAGTSAPSNAVTFTVAASAPTASGLTPKHGPAVGGTSVTVTGTGFVPGRTSITIGGVQVPARAVSVNRAGTSLTFLTPPHAPGRVSVVVTTPGGDSNPLRYTYDPVDAPIITDPTDGSTVTTPTPPISGNGTPGDTVTVTEGGTVICTGIVDAHGAWKCTPATPLSNGVHTISATQTDAAGNVSPAGNQVSFTVDAGVTATPSSSGLPTTGSNLIAPLTAAIVLLMLGMAIVGLGRRRRA